MQLLADLKYGVRAMRRAKLFTLIAVLTLAVGIGANTAMFSVVYGVLLRPLAYPDADRLVFVWHAPPQSSFPGAKIFAVSAANYFDWKAQAKSFEQMSVIGGARFNLTGAGEPIALIGRTVSPEYFAIMGTAPMLGRTFAPDQDQPGNDHVVVLSYGLWQKQFGGDGNVIGRTVDFDDVPYTIIGVMPPEFARGGPAFWAPITFTPGARAVRGEHSLLVVARLKKGVDLKAARAEMTTISRRLEAAYPADNKGWGATVIPMQEQMVGNVRPALLILLGAVGFVLLIACANVANLMLAKVFDRRGEISIRTALGASRGRVVKQMLTESALLGIAGGALGAVLASVGVRAIVRHLSDQLPRAAEITVDYWVLAFTLLISVLSGVITGVAPAWRLSNANLSDALKQVGRGADTGGKRTRSVLVVAEVALSLVLLAGAGLLLRSLWNLQRVDPGFDPKGALTARLSVPRTRFTQPEQAASFYERIHQALRTVPGIESAALVDSLPFAGGSTQPMQLEGHPVVEMADQPEVPVRVVSSDYFRAMRIRLVRGRAFAESDTRDRLRVAVISRAMAKKFWPSEDAIGKHVTLTFFQGGPREIVGVVDDVKIDGLAVTDSIPTLYWPVSQLDPLAARFGEFRTPSLSLVVRTSLKPETLASAVTTAVHQVDATTPVLDVRSLDDVVGGSLEPQRFNMFLLGTFAVIALLLATVGIYSVLAYSVRRRTAEIGIRLALGAKTRDVLALVIGEGMGLVLAGVGIGIVGALAVSRVLRSLVFGTGTADLATFTAVALLFCLVALGACYLPARRAARVDPLAALRYE
jgi:putative ABC transport system permease protein